MDVNTGKLYPSFDAAVAAGVDPVDLVMLDGPEPAVRAVAQTVRDHQDEHTRNLERAKAKARRANRAANRRARRARRRNR